MITKYSLGNFHFFHFMSVDISVFLLSSGKDYKNTVSENHYMRKQEVGIRCNPKTLIIGHLENNRQTRDSFLFIHRCTLIYAHMQDARFKIFTNFTDLYTELVIFFL